MADKTHKNKSYAWVNEETIGGILYTIMRGIIDPTDFIVIEINIITKVEKVNEFKNKKTKDEWQKVKDKKPKAVKP